MTGSPEHGATPSNTAWPLHHHARLAPGRSQGWKSGPSGGPTTCGRQRSRARLVGQAARLSLAIERGERIETAHLAGRVRKAARERMQARRRASRFASSAAGCSTSPGRKRSRSRRMPLWADDPELLVSQLEESAEGCRWLLERWEEYRNLLDRKIEVGRAGILLRFIRLQGKNVVESVYDPALNAIFLAWDVLVPKYAKERWESFRNEGPRTDPAFNHRLHWREIADRPSDPAAAWAVLYASRRSTRRPAQGAAGQATRPAKRPRTPIGPTARRSIAARRSSGTGGPSRPRHGSCCGRWIHCAKCGSAEFGMRNGKRRGSGQWPVVSGQ